MLHNELPFEGLTKWQISQHNASLSMDVSCIFSYYSLPGVVTCPVGPSWLSIVKILSKITFLFYYVNGANLKLDLIIFCS